MWKWGLGLGHMGNRSLVSWWMQWCLDFAFSLILSIKLMWNGCLCMTDLWDRSLGFTHIWYWSFSLALYILYLGLNITKHGSRCFRLAMIWNDNHIVSVTWHWVSRLAFMWFIERLHGLLKWKRRPIIVMWVFEISWKISFFALYFSLV